MDIHNKPLNGPDIPVPVDPQDTPAMPPDPTAEVPDEWPTAPYPPEETPEILPGEVEQPIDPEWPGAPRLPDDVPGTELPTTPPPPNTGDDRIPPFGI